MNLRWKVWLAAFGLFVAGLAVGAFITVGVGVRAVRRALRAPATATVNTPIDRAAQRIHATLTRELELTPEQSALVRDELARTAGELRRLRVDTVIQVRRALEDSVHRMGAPLTPEQRAELEQRATERFARFGWTYTSAPEGETAPRP